MTNEEGIARLTKDQKEAAKNLNPEEVRYFVDNYYMIQENRKASGNQRWALEQNQEPNQLISWYFDQNKALEQRAKKVLDIYTDQNPTTIWAKGIVGIGPVISAGLIAYIDITRAPTAGHIWSYAGLNPSVRWLGNEGAEKVVKEITGKKSGNVTNEDIVNVANRVNRRPENIFLAMNTGGKDGETLPYTVKSLVKCVAKRPWNHNLKVLCWKIGESFMKVSNRPNDFYGKLWAERKERETIKNANGDFKPQADSLVENASPKYKQTEAYQHNLEGRLSPGHINERAKRYAVKLFLAHFHEVYYMNHYGKKPPNPYPIAHLGHTHKIEPPGLD